jgi:hypothetical protein
VQVRGYIKLVLQESFDQIDRGIGRSRSAFRKNHLVSFEHKSFACSSPLWIRIPPGNKKLPLSNFE